MNTTSKTEGVGDSAVDSDPAIDETVRATYDTVAEDYAAQYTDELRDKPLDRGLIEAFAHQVKALGPQVGDPMAADVGCGPGHITRFVADLGLPIIGVDLSPRMVELARGLHPDIAFHEGSITALPAADRQWTGLMSLYSIIHTPPELLPAVFTEFARVLRPGGRLLLAFHVGDQKVHLDEWFGHAVSLDGCLLDPAHVAGLLEAAGFAVDARVERRPYPGIALSTDRAYLFAQRTAD